MYGGFTINKLTILLAALLILLGSGIGTAEIFVQPGDSIQAAVNNANATSDNVIILKPGTYTENIKINTNNLVIKSESGNPDDTIIKVRNSNDNVVSLQNVNNVQVRGLEIIEAKSGYAGIYLSKCNKCIIDHNKLLSNGYGILCLASNDNTFSDNTASNNEYGVNFGTSDGNTFSGNTISFNTVQGLYVCPTSDNNVVFNNYFNNVVNKEIKNGVGNAYNTAKTAGKNIVGGPFIGGNYWAKPDGTGFSQTAVDGDGDGFADSAYQFENSIYVDQLPLISASNLPVANFKMSPSNGHVPLSVQFNDLSQNVASWSWDFDNDGKIDSTEQNPVNVYTIPVNFAVKLTVSNKNGIDCKTASINVQEESSSGSGSSSSSEGSSHSGSGSISGGGGGAGGSPEPQSNVETKELSQAFITSGKAVNFDFPKNATSIVYVSFDSKKTTGKITTIVEMLKEKSALVSVPLSDEVYKYLNIWVGNSGFATSENIENPIVCFKVEKSWVQDKNIDPSSITLNRYNDKTWEQLQTNKSGEDDNYLYFTTKTPEFSFLAITGKVKTAETALIGSSDQQSGLNIDKTSRNDNNIPLVSDVEKALEGKASAKSPGFEAVYGIISLIAFSLYRRDKFRK